MEEKLTARPHRITIQNRSSGTITGIVDVVSFDENTIVLDTDQGLLTIKGNGLHVSRLTLEKGEVDVDGTVYYSNLQNGDGCADHSRIDPNAGYEFMPSDFGELVV